MQGLDPNKAQGQKKRKIGSRMLKIWITKFVSD